MIAVLLPVVHGGGMLLMGRSCTATWWVPGMVAVTPLGGTVVHSTWLLGKALAKWGWCLMLVLGQCYC